MNVAPISFCNRTAFNVRNDSYKTKILKEIFDKFQIIINEKNTKIYNKSLLRIILKKMIDF